MMMIMIIIVITITILIIIIIKTVVTIIRSTRRVHTSAKKFDTWQKSALSG